MQMELFSDKSVLPIPADKSDGNIMAERTSLSLDQLNSILLKCHETLCAGGRLSSYAAFNELTKLILLKYLSESRPANNAVALYLRDGETDHQLAQRVRRFYDQAKGLEPNIVTGEIDSSPEVIARCIHLLSGIVLSHISIDVMGVAFQKVITQTYKSDLGQYFTPNSVVTLITEMLQPKVDQRILDPACGSGGFLVNAIEYMRHNAEWQVDNCYGIELNAEITRVARINMLIRGVNPNNIVCHDGLDAIDRLTEKNHQIQEGSFDIVLANPPFGNTIRRTEKGDGYMDKFEVLGYLGTASLGSDIAVVKDGSRGQRGGQAVKKRASIKTEIAFLERIHTFLKPGTGRAAVVLPDGLLTNLSMQGIRNWMLSRFQLMAVVSLPQFAFQNYGAGVKASIVFLRRLSNGETVSDDTPIFMAIPENIGYDANGRYTFISTLENETQSQQKIEVHSCDLFDYRVYYKWSQVGGKRFDWIEQRREIIPYTGLAGIYYGQFKDNPASLMY